MEKGREAGAPAANAATAGASSSTATTTTAAATSYASTTKTPEVQVVEQAPRRRAGAPKRKSNHSNTSGISSTPSKRLAKERPPVPLPPNHNGPCTRARQSPNKLALAAAAAAAATSAPEKLAESVPPHVSCSSGEGVAAAEESNAAKESWQALESIMDAEFEAVRSRDANAHVVPTHAGWFSWTKIHPLEERAMASFFNGKSEKRTPDIYMGIRNLIMKKFHADPQTPVELKDLSELSVGEPDARQEVMEFLDYWGLINFHPFPPSDSVMANAEVDGIVNTASLLEKLYRFDTVQFRSPGPRTDFSAPVVPPHLFPETAIVDDLVRPEGPSVEYHCNSCSADCSRKRYHCQKQADFDLCSECYNDGKFDSGMSPADFILMEPAEAPGVSGGSWTDQETLLLLEALELYGENWNEIAEHVATKTKAQCIMHFVQMPIEDMFLEGTDDFDASSQGNTNPGSTNNNSSALKDVPETTESKANKESKSTANEDSVSTANEESKITANEESKITANEESKSTANEGKSLANEEQSLSSQMDLSKSKDGSQFKVASDLDTNHALKALKEAFQAVSSLPEPGGSLSFAEAGNPVMTLAAFLARLVEPNVAAASARSLLKAISEDSPSIQLATRHCFLLEDPSDDVKEPCVSESAVVEMVDAEAQNKNQDVEHQGDEARTSNLDGTDASNDSTVKKIENAVPKEEPFASPNEGSTEKLCVSKVLDDAATEEMVTTSSQDKVSPSTQQVVEPTAVKESSEPALPGDEKSNSMKDDLALPAEDPPSSVNKSVDVGSVVEATQCEEVPKAVDMEPDPIPSEEKEKETQQPVALTSVVHSGTDEKTADNTDQDNTKQIDCKSEKKCKLNETKDHHNVDKAKCAAITAISAAAVKAKLLAKQEEDQIRQLTTFLIEKQVHKLETKLAFFSEMEGMIIKVKEQMDRSRQRLYQERAQIIATRLGLPASSSRALPTSYPNSKIPMGYTNSVPKPLPSISSSKPSVKRTMMTSAPLLSNASIPNSVTGSLSHPSNQDKLSSVGTNL
ncbi:SWI/SNF complex subunit SWI3D [Macadamia integrifolia]|uniref:SWI/SNF complex subunit SWI3D n=1 Tax=Macadamia integrifolia TaxID=60698 RepID=UPI001C4EDB44|nr:SWI/SNF complex subunit SWI3D [Macadamia integrifolia]